MTEVKECCVNCKHLVEYPRNNRYKDVDYLCLCTGYFVSGIHKDKNRVKRYSPGGKKLDCNYQPKKEREVI